MSPLPARCALATVALLAAAPAAAATQATSATPKAAQGQPERPAPADNTTAQQAPDSLPTQPAPDTPPATNLEGIVEDETASEPPAATTGGFLGQSTWFDALMLLAAALAGALIALLSSWSRSATPLGFDLARMRNRLDRIETGLKAQANLSTPPSGGTPSRYDAVDTRRRTTSHSASEDSYRLPSEDAAGDDPADATRRELRERNSRMERVLADYSKLVATKGTKPRQFTQLVAEFPEARAIRMDQVHGLSTEPFREGDANQFVVAVGDGRRFAVLPTYEYISDFSIVFSAPVQNPEHVRQLFELAADDTAQIRLESPAVVDIDENGAVQIVRRGRLSGFRS